MRIVYRQLLAAVLLILMLLILMLVAAAAVASFCSYCGWRFVTYEYSYYWCCYCFYRLFCYGCCLVAAVEDENAATSTIDIAVGAAIDVAALLIWYISNIYILPYWYLVRYWYCCCYFPLLLLLLLLLMLLLLLLLMSLLLKLVHGVSFIWSAAMALIIDTNCASKVSVSVFFVREWRSDKCCKF